MLARSVDWRKNIYYSCKAGCAEKSLQREGVITSRGQLLNNLFHLRGIFSDFNKI